MLGLTFTCGLIQQGQIFTFNSHQKKSWTMRYMLDIMVCQLLRCGTTDTQTGKSMARKTPYSSCMIQLERKSTCSSYMLEKDCG